MKFAVPVMSRKNGSVSKFPIMTVGDRFEEYTKTMSSGTIFTVRVFDTRKESEEYRKDKKL